VLDLCLNLGRTYTFHCRRKSQRASNWLGFPLMAMPFMSYAVRLRWTVATWPTNAMTTQKQYQSAWSNPIGSEQRIKSPLLLSFDCGRSSSSVVGRGHGGVNDPLQRTRCRVHRRSHNAGRSLLCWNFLVSDAQAQLPRGHLLQPQARH